MQLKQLAPFLRSISCNRKSTASRALPSTRNVRLFNSLPQLNISKPDANSEGPFLDWGAEMTELLSWSPTLVNTDDLQAPVFHLRDLEWELPSLAEVPAKIRERAAAHLLTTDELQRKGLELWCLSALLRFKSLPTSVFEDVVKACLDVANPHLALTLTQKLFDMRQKYFKFVPKLFVSLCVLLLLEVFCLILTENFPIGATIKRLLPLYPTFRTSIWIAQSLLCSGSVFW